MELQWIGVALLFGLLAKRLGQPPLIGFLAAGFGLEIFAADGPARETLAHALSSLGVGAAQVPDLRPNASLTQLADVGVLLMLFAIGLKLEVKSILRPEVWGVTLLHASASTLFFGALSLAAATTGLSMFAGLSVGQAMLIGFALAFSSTVLAIKVIEERDDMAALYGRVAIGILVVQDLVAVIFLAVSEGKVPSIGALALLLLWPLRPRLHRLLEFMGHGELLVLGGLALALGGASLFALVGMKADLGALVMGVVLGGHDKSKELAKSLGSMKDVFLVGFFLTVGLTGAPTLPMVVIAFGLALLVPLKGILFAWMLTRFRLRARSSALASLTLANYSEFGLIIGGLAVKKGWLGSEWLVTLALAMAFSFVVATPFNKRAFELYQRYQARLTRWETAQRIPEEQPVVVGVAEALVFGMGRVGTGAYDLLREKLGEVVVGFDIDEASIDAHRQHARRVFLASATDPEFWSRLHVERDRVRIVLLAMSSHVETVASLELLRAEGFAGMVVAAAHHRDDMEALRAAGADRVFHILAEAGSGLAEHALEDLEVRESLTG